MQKKILKFVVVAGVIGAIIYLVVVLYPRVYDVPVFESRPATQYWKMADGSTIGYTVISKRMDKKPYPVLFLHGGPGAHITDAHIEALRPIADLGYRVYLYDQTGSGHSDRLSDISQYSVQRHMDDIKAIMQKLKTQKVILIGQSWGAVLATMFAAEHPDLVHAMVLTSPGPIFPVNPALATLVPPDSIRLKEPVYFNADGNRKANHLRTKAMKFMATTLGLKLVPDAEADQFMTFLNEQVDRSTVCDTSKILPASAGSGYYTSVMTFKSLLAIKDPREKIRKLQMPVLVMKGECDNQKWGYTNEYLQLLHQSQFVCIPGAGHAIAVEQPELYIRSIMMFLAEQ
jgi:proline iminopeptidase